MAPDKENGLTEWERKRNANALANNEVLRSAGTASLKIFGPTQTKVDRKTPAPRKKTEPVKHEAPRPTRRSARVAGLEADEETLKRKFEIEVEAQAKEQKEKRLRVSGDLNLSDIAVDGKAWGKSLDGLAKIQLSFRGAQPGTRTFTDDDIKDTTDADLKELRQRMSGLEMYDKFEVKDLKLTKDRVYSMGFHPTEEKALIFAGDKEGRMGIFDASQEPAEVGDDDDEPALPEISSFKSHARTITSFVFSPADANSVYTASYDLSIRKLDIKEGKSIEIWAPRDDASDMAVSCLDMSASNPNVMFFSTLAGHVGRYDMRLEAMDAEVWSLHDHKIGGFALNPINPELLATASLDRSLKIWDLRKISGKGSMRHPHLVGEHDSRLSVSHASWSGGGHIATSSYDDTIKVYDLSDSKSWGAGHDLGDFEPSSIIKHNNQTGRWVTILKPQWQKHPRDGIQKFAIGNMNRFVDVYAANGEQLAQLDGEGITAVPAVAHFHPTMDWVAGGNASGKLTLWM